MQAGAQNLYVTERVTFARDIRPEVNSALQNTVACAGDFERAREYQYQARALDPDQPEVYVALYKFCQEKLTTNRGHFDEAERIALDALARLDPDDQVGGSVNMTLAASIEDDESVSALAALKQVAGK